jgi:cytidylate kinase
MTFMRNHKIIAIDGPSASGKGTLAKSLATKLGYAYLDTGALYRTVGLSVLEQGGNPEDEGTAIIAAQNLRIVPGFLENPALRTDEAGQAGSKVAKYQGVRDSLLAFQRNFAQNPPLDAGGVILDGRDIGTVICPDADVKLFITASMEERAARRHKELTSKGVPTDFERVLADMALRDARDSGRDAAPLKPAMDAHIIDTTGLDAGAALEMALSLIHRA